MFNRSIVYLSDVSYIPESTWGLLLGGAEQAWKQFSTDELQQTTVLTNDAFQMRDLVKNGSSPQGRLSATHVVATLLPPILVIDCPRVWAYTSHWGRVFSSFAFAPVSWLSIYQQVPTGGRCSKTPEGCQNIFDRFCSSVRGNCPDSILHPAYSLCQNAGPCTLLGRAYVLRWKMVKDLVTHPRLYAVDSRKSSATWPVARLDLVCHTAKWRKN